jgi:hypothetical protein
MERLLSNAGGHFDRWLQSKQPETSAVKWRGPAPHCGAGPHKHFRVALVFALQKH